jgi:nicotinate-nucleotide adenylyltransferase
VSDIELRRSGPTYTIDTVHQLKLHYPNAEIYWVAGADVLNNLELWKDVQELVNLVKFVVVSRPGYAQTIGELHQLATRLPAQLTDSLTFLEIDAFDISSTQLREFRN